MRKYYQVFKNALLVNIVEYRFDFVMMRVRNVVFLLTLYCLWTAVYSSRANIAGFTWEQMISYLFISNIIFSFLFVTAEDEIAECISFSAYGGLASYLVKPVSFLGFWFVRRLANRVSHLVLSLVETAVLMKLLGLRLALPSEFSIFGIVGLLILALAVFVLFDFLVGLTAFWTLRAYGPRFMFKVLMEFASGRYFPLVFLPFGLGTFLKYLPFSFFTFWPTTLIQGGSLPGVVWVVGLGWALVLAVALRLVWKKGLRVYEAAGG